MGRQLELHPAWLDRLAQLLARLPADEPLPHPYERIVGGLLLAMPNAPRALGRRLEATAETKGLSGWIAATYLAAARGQVAPGPPESLQSWWEQYDLAARTETEGPLGALTMNYL